MLKDLQKLFRQTWDSFRSELGRREPEDEVAELLTLMRREMVESRALLPELDAALQELVREMDKEKRALADCERRAGLAERIGDAETVRIASEFAQRHREHLSVLEQKHAATAAERDLRRRELEQMSDRYREAEANRFVLVAELRRQRAAGNLRDALDGKSGAFGDFERMEQAIRDKEAYADALDELADEPAAPPDRDIREKISSLEERLSELKRRMGKS